jgi:hypothetical protein
VLSVGGNDANTVRMGLDGDNDDTLAVNLVPCGMERHACGQVLLDLRAHPTLIKEVAVSLRHLARGASAFVSADHDVTSSGRHPGDVLREHQQMTSVVEM